MCNAGVGLSGLLAVQQTEGESMLERYEHAVDRGRVALAHQAVPMLRVKSERYRALGADGRVQVCPQPQQRLC